MGFSFEFDEDSLNDALRDAKRAVGRASQKTLRALAKQIEQEARADIARAGFGPEWQRGLHATVYPTRGAAIDSTVFINHDIPYASIFETGGTIRGRPLLWIPLPKTPKVINGQPTTAALYAKNIGPLTFVHARRPLLMATVDGKRVPVFVGVSAVTIPQKFHINQIAARAAQRLEEMFQSNLSDN